MLKIKRVTESRSGGMLQDAYNKIKDARSLVLSAAHAERQSGFSDIANDLEGIAVRLEVELDALEDAIGSVEPY